MHESLEVAAPAATAKRRNRLQRGAMDCVGIHVIVAKAVWPKKTAENWASKAGVKTRMAQYWLSGKPVSDSGKLALRKLLD